MLLAATAFVLLVQIPNLLLRLAIIGVALVISIGLSSWSVKSMRARILKRVHDAAEVEVKT